MNRRQFWHYLAGGTISSLSLGYLLPARSRKPDLEDLCSRFPQNSRCQDYLPGVQALDEKGNPLQPDLLLSAQTSGVPIPVKGLSRLPVTYLIVTDKHEIANYGINPTCTHLGCTVNWKAEQNRFICPCHGSQYDPQGRVVHGPAKRSLPLITVVVKQHQIRLVDQKPALDPR
ncbi:MAG: Rieske 2Fe-2S domain-containing protein [Scytolyngbya sp. HA4215-MV1]|jgi:cytochrome b6-f complex iron-sulfur subunit|nr:Rieske 2Fe-2S domain-containing protein [Scytolyngbya sp. HA4215-MV1]